MRLKEIALAFLLVCSLSIQSGSLAQIEDIAVSSLAMPIPLDQLRPLTAELVSEVIELGWFRYYGENQSTGWIYALALSDDGRFLATGDGTGFVPIWNTSTGEKIALLQSRYETVRDIAFSPDNQKIAIASGDGPSTVRVWNMETDTVQWLMEIDGLTTSLDFSPDGNTLAIAADYTGQLFIVDAILGKLIHTLPVGRYRNVVRFSPNGELIAVSTNSTVIAWDAENFRELYTTKSFGGPSLDFSPDGTYIAAGIDDAKVTILDAASGQLIQQTTMYAETSVVFSATEDLVIILSSGYIWFWDVSDNRLIHAIEASYINIEAHVQDE